MKNFRIIAPFACLALFISSAQIYAQTPQAKRVDFIVQSIETVVSAADEPLSNRRIVKRQQALKKAVSNAILKMSSDGVVQINKVDKGDKELDSAYLLCDQRKDVDGKIYQHAFLKNVGLKVANTNKSKKLETMLEAIKSLGANYSLDFEPKSDEDVNKENEQIANNCYFDLINYDQPMYGVNLRSTDQRLDPVGAFFAVQAVWNLFKEVVGPFIIDGAQMIDDAKRQKAIRDYFRKEENRKAIVKAADIVSEYVSKVVWEQRLVKAGEVDRDMIILRNLRIDTSKDPFCQVLARSSDGPAKHLGNLIDAQIDDNDTPMITRVIKKRGANRQVTVTTTTIQALKLPEEFVMCHVFVMSKVDKIIKRLAINAAVYDKLADAGDSDNIRNDFAKAAEYMKNITGTTTTEQIDLLWYWTSRLASYVSKVEEAINPEGRQKIKDQVAAILEEIQLD